MEATAPVTVEQAAAALGVSPSTVHRRIRTGALKAEQAERPQGRVWLIHLPPGTTVGGADLPPPGEPEATAATTVAPAAEAMVSLIQTTIGTVLGPLVGQLDAQRQTIERQADTIGQLRADLATAQAENRTLLASTATPSPDPTTGPPWTRRPRGWAAVAATVLVAICVVVVLLRWPW